jgi:hypothetical protein
MPDERVRELVQFLGQLHCTCDALERVVMCVGDGADEVVKASAARREIAGCHFVNLRLSMMCVNQQLTLMLFARRPELCPRYGHRTNRMVALVCGPCTADLTPTNSVIPATTGWTPARPQPGRSRVTTSRSPHATCDGPDGGGSVQFDLTCGPALPGRIDRTRQVPRFRSLRLMS